MALRRLYTGMRRLLAALVLVAAVPVAPSAAAPAVPVRTVRHVPGRITLDGDVPVADRVHRAYESLAVTKESRDLLRTYEPAMARAAATGDEQRISGALTGPDLDGDRVGDVLVYDMTFWLEGYHFEGTTTLASVSGRTGRQTWRRTFEDVPVPMLSWQKVGDRRPGLVLIDITGDVLADFGFRFVGIGGSRGDIVYDTHVSNSDARGGMVQFGGFFDAFTGGGDDILVARVERVVGIDVGVGGVLPPGVDFTQAYVVDGRNGALRAVSERDIGVGGAPAFSVAPDLDGDKRDDYVMFRRGLREGEGSVAARSVVENKRIWSNDATPVGWWVAVWGPFGDHAGDKREDLMYLTSLDGNPLIQVPGVTDEMELFRGELPGTHAVILDGRDGSLVRHLADGTATLYQPFPDTDRDGKLDILTVAWASNLREGGVQMALLTAGGSRTRWRREVMVPADVPGAAKGGGVRRHGRRRRRRRHRRPLVPGGVRQHVAHDAHVRGVPAHAHRDPAVHARLPAGGQPRRPRRRPRRVLVGQGWLVLVHAGRAQRGVVVAVHVHLADAWRRPVGPGGPARALRRRVRRRVRAHAGGERPGHGVGGDARRRHGPRPVGEGAQRPPAHATPVGARGASRSLPVAGVRYLSVSEHP